MLATGYLFSANIKWFQNKTIPESNIIIYLLFLKGAILGMEIIYYSFALFKFLIFVNLILHLVINFIFVI